MPCVRRSMDWCPMSGKTRIGVFGRFGGIIFQRSTGQQLSHATSRSVSQRTVGRLWSCCGALSRGRAAIIPRDEQLRCAQDCRALVELLRSAFPWLQISPKLHWLLCHAAEVMLIWDYRPLRGADLGGVAGALQPARRSVYCCDRASILCARAALTGSGERCNGCIAAAAGANSQADGPTEPPGPYWRPAPQGQQAGSAALPLHDGKECKRAQGMGQGAVLGCLREGRNVPR